MAKAVEDSQGNVSDSPRRRPIGRVFLDAVAEAILNTILFVFKFVGWSVQWTFATVFFLAVMAGAAWYVFNQAVQGGKHIVVPDVVGMSVPRAMAELAKDGLEMGTQTPMPTEGYPANYVLLQRPSATKVVREGRKVAVTVSAGQSLETVPSVVGKDYKQAASDLRDARFGQGPESRLPHSAPRGSVIAQFPPGGSARIQGTEVSLLISDGLGADQMFMPDLVSIPIKEAIERLKTMNVPCEVFSVRSDSEDFATVLKQDPEAGTLLIAGASASLETRLYDGADVPNVRRRVDVTLSLPANIYAPQVKVDLVDGNGARTPVAVPQNLVAGATFTIQKVTYTDEATVEMYINAVLYESHYYEGDKNPLVKRFSNPPPENEAPMQIEALDEPVISVQKPGPRDIFVRRPRPNP